MDVSNKHLPSTVGSSVDAELCIIPVPGGMGVQLMMASAGYAILRQILVASAPHIRREGADNRFGVVFQVDEPKGDFPALRYDIGLFGVRIRKQVPRIGVHGRMAAGKVFFGEYGKVIPLIVKGAEQHVLMAQPGRDAVHDYALTVGMPVRVVAGAAQPCALVPLFGR